MGTYVMTVPILMALGMSEEDKLSVTRDVDIESRGV